MASLRYTHGIVCRVPLSFRSQGEINFEEAKRQHEAYVRLLRDIGLDVIELPPDETLPECIYVEDTAVICNGIALITRPGNSLRLKEVDTVRAIIKKELDIPIVEIADTTAKLDGGDVLFTGREFFVGLSKWTNEAGARAVAAAFPEYPCTPIKVTDTEHLKSLISMAGPDVFCVSSGKASQEVLKRIAREATFTYQTLTVPEEDAANVLYINGTLIHRASDEIPESNKIFAEKVDFSRHTLRVSELLKDMVSIISPDSAGRFQILARAIDGHHDPTPTLSIGYESSANGPAAGGGVARLQSPAQVYDDGLTHKQRRLRGTLVRGYKK